MTRFYRASALFRVAAYLLCISSLISAEEILFIGNSFTHGQDARLSQHGGMPKVFQAIARDKGKDINATMMAPSGKDWGFHLENPKTLRIIESRKWDAVVLQDYSTKPTRIGNRKAFFENGQNLCELIWKSSPDAKIVLYRTWARHPEHDFYSTQEKISKFRDFDQMDSQLGEGYGELFKKLTAANPEKEILLAPVGDAFAHCSRAFPEVAVYGADLYHAGVDGSYLAALVFLKTIYGESPVGAIRKFPTFSVDEATAEILQKLADTHK